MPFAAADDSTDDVPFAAFVASGEEVDSATEDDSTLDATTSFPFPAFPLAFPFAFAAEVALEALADVVAAALPFFAAALVLEATTAAAVSTAPGPAFTADAAAEERISDFFWWFGKDRENLPAAPAIPADPSFAAALMVVPDPETVNFVQSSAVPR